MFPSHLIIFHYQFFFSIILKRNYAIFIFMIIILLYLTHEVVYFIWNNAFQPWRQNIFLINLILRKKIVYALKHILIYKGNNVLSRGSVGFWIFKLTPASIPFQFIFSTWREIRSICEYLLRDSMICNIIPTFTHNKIILN